MTLINSTRCKFHCFGVTPMGQDSIEVKLQAHYDSKLCEEDNAFSKYTPSGEFTAIINNPNVIPLFEVGKSYYLDITPVEAGA